MLIDDIAKRFRQNTDSCLFASILFSLALQFRGVESGNRVLEDIDHIVNGRRSYRQLECEIDSVSLDDSDLGEWTDERSFYAFVEEILAKKRQGKLQSYLAGSGYTIEMRHPSLDQLAKTVERYPLIYLRNLNPEFFDMPAPFYVQHVISAVRLEDGKIAFFEPYAGEIRDRDISLIERMWVGIGVIKTTNSD